MSSSAKSGVKRSLRTISAHGKLEAIRRVHDGESKASVARDIGVPESTLRGWCKNESKISYLSRQSSPDTDESLAEAKEKRPRLPDDAVAHQPFNLSLKPSYEAMDCSKPPAKPDTTTTTIATTTATPKNRAELARLSVELGLNRPEMFATATTTPTSSSNSLADLAANISLLSQWNNILVQHQLQQTKKPPTEKQSSAAAKPPKEQQSVEEYINSWLKAQEAMLTSQPTTTRQPAANGHSPSNSGSLNGGSAAVQNSWFWNWYKQLSYGQQQPAAAAAVSEKPILYQQLTKEAENAENLTVAKSEAVVVAPAAVNNNNVVTSNNNNNHHHHHHHHHHNHHNHHKSKSVLDNLLLINNNNVAVEKGKVEKECSISHGEAMEHGEKFLRWLESYSNPSVTAMQIMQFKGLLNNVKNSVDRKNGDLQNKTKVKRK